MGWEPYQTVDPLEKEPQVCRGLFGVRSINSSLQNSIFQIHQIFNISYFPQFNLSFEKKNPFTECPKIIQKFTQKRKTLVNVLSGAIWHCLKRERDIGTKATLSDIKTAFR